MVQETNFLTVLKAGKSQEDQGTSTFLVRWPSSGCVFTWRTGGKGKEALWGLFHKGTNLIQEVSTQDLISSRRPHLLIPSHWELGLNVWVGEDAKQSIAVGNSSRAGMWPASLCLCFSHSHPDTHSKVTETKSNQANEDWPGHRENTDHH